MTTRVALVLPEDSELHYDYTRRPKIPYEQAWRVAVAFCDGAYVAACRVSGIVHPNVERTMHPEYATLRNYLIDEANTDERVAAHIALKLTAPLRRMT